MTAAVESYAARVQLPAAANISDRAARAVLGVYARICQADGTFRWGLRGSKVAEKAGYSLPTVRRIQRYLVEHGFLEKVEVGGGRKSTKWRVVLERLGIRYGSGPKPPPQPDRPDTAQERAPGLLKEMFSRALRSKPHGMSPPVAETCGHGNRAGLMPDRGIPWCPSCRAQRWGPGSPRVE